MGGAVCLSISEMNLRQHSDMASKTGRPSKGNRGAIMTRPSAEFAAILKRNADEQGMYYGDYLVALAAQALNMPQYSPVRVPENQLDIPEEAHPRAA